MRIITVRRLAQIFFFGLAAWFCVVTTLGDHWWQLRGWPVNWLLQLDPLVALGTMLTTGTLYAGLLWALLTVGLTILLGRFFCGWVCPFGALHQFIGWLGARRKKHTERVALNQYRSGQRIKYYLLIGLLAAAGGGRLVEWLWRPHTHPTALVASSLQTGLLDPIPLFHRSMNLVILTAFNGPAASRIYVAGGSIAAVFFAALLLNLWIPRFYCRFVCPLGALFGVLTRWTPWRVGKRQGECRGCELCENHCEGACDPFGKIHPHECLLCLNCLRACRQAQMTYSPQRSAAGEVPSPALSRRGFLTAAVAGLAAVPAVRLAGGQGQNWNAVVVRPPGALAEEEFLQRCLKCGQCMRVCPTNVIQPATLEAGLEGVWTPLLNFRAGTSGCQLNCIACGNVCPTAAIRPLSLEEKLGRGDFAERGPVRLGLAFLDRGRCLPWAMDEPCIVCQENCPISPKAIYVREEYQVVRDGARMLTAATPDSLTLAGAALRPGTLGTGDYFIRLDNAAGERRLIADNTAQDVKPAQPWAAAPAAGDRIFLEVRLQQPFVDPAQCIGCGICEHECPVSGRRAIRITAENESRNQRHSLTAKA
jgi:polyferredoxin